MKRLISQELSFSSYNYYSCKDLGSYQHSRSSLGIKCIFFIQGFLSLRVSDIHLFYNLQLFYWHFLEILWLIIFLVLYFRAFLTPHGHYKGVSLLNPSSSRMHVPCPQRKDEPTWRCHQNPFIGALGIQEPVMPGEPLIEG